MASHFLSVFPLAADPRSHDVISRLNHKQISAAQWLIFCSTTSCFRTYTKRAFLTPSFVVFDKLVGSASFLSSQKMDLIYLPQLREFQGQEISPLQSSDDETYLLWYLIYLISQTLFWYLIPFFDISYPYFISHILFRYLTPVFVAIVHLTPFMHSSLACRTNLSDCTSKKLFLFHLKHKVCHSFVIRNTEQFLHLLQKLYFSFTRGTLSGEKLFSWLPPWEVWILCMGMGSHNLSSKYVMRKRKGVHRWTLDSLKSKCHKNAWSRYAGGWWSFGRGMGGVGRPP